jgi:hypothetical protein
MACGLSTNGGDNITVDMGGVQVQEGKNSTR